MGSSAANNRPYILCFLDSEQGRDPEILLPLIYFAEKILRCRVEYSFMWNIDDIRRKKPDIVLLPNTIGSKLHFRVAKYAYENGIKVFALISEGNFRTDGSFDYFGYNSDKQFYQEYICHWSQRTKEFFDRELPSLRHKNVFTGATGFDRYKIYHFEEKHDFLKRYNLPNFKRIVGYAGWAFGKIYNQQGRDELKLYFEDFDAGMLWMEDQMKKVEAMLRAAVERYPETLFILKRHPNEANPTITAENPNEMISLRNYPNVLYITGNENLHDLINVCDIWTAFESTTALEAWLMGKETIFLNPDPDFNRDKIYLGNPLAKDPESFTRFIEKYYEKGSIPEFHSENLVNNRKMIIADTIGKDDGMNHIRAGYYLGKVLEKIRPGEGKEKNIRFSFRYWFMHFLLRAGKFFYNRKLFLMLPKFKKTVWMFETYKLEKVHELRNRYGKYLGEFYQRNKIGESYENGTLRDRVGK